MKFERICHSQYMTDNIYQHIEYYNIKLPKRATKKSAGYDIYSTMDFELKPRQTILVPTGIKVELDSDKVLIIAPRSGQGFKYKVQLYNTVGVIDADYYSNINNDGHIWVKLYNDSPDGESLIVKKGDAICQGIIVKYYTVEDEEEVKNERQGGFGSTSGQ